MDINWQHNFLISLNKFKGITRDIDLPYAQYYKGAYAYASSFNTSSTAFVTGNPPLKLFQLNAPIIAGQAFFEFTGHYFGILKDIQSNDKYVGSYLKGHIILKTLELTKYKTGTGNKITRRLFDSALLLYIDRFCSVKPSKKELVFFEQFLVLAFIWAYSLRSQYQNLGWPSALNFILRTRDKPKKNALNIYKLISEAVSPVGLFNTLSYKLTPLSYNRLAKSQTRNIDEKKNGIPQHYLYFFKQNQFLEIQWPNLFCP